MKFLSKHTFALALLCFACTGLYAQVHESLTPLRNNTEIMYPQTRAADIYVYAEDTLSLPVKDDFSTSKFRKYNATPTDPNVTTQQFFHLLDGSSVPFPAGTSFSKYQTFRLKRDTVGTDTTYRIPLPGQTITVDTLYKYPITGYTATAYPCYNIVDSTLINAADIPDTVYLPACTWTQDSVYVRFVSSIDQSTAVWLDSYAYHNFRYAARPPTLGVVTFDGLSEKGYPYDFSGVSSEICDHLTTKFIDLSGLSAGDSVFLSFFYQSGGFGNEPEYSDSLVLEFLKVGGSPEIENDWRHAWSTPGTGTPPGSAAFAPYRRFKQVMVHIKDPQFLHAGFKFRFKNYGVRSGSVDHWHLDYVFLDRLRSKNDTIGGLSREDVAFQYQAVTMLNNRYTSMPLKHYATNPLGFMRDTLSLFKRNNDVGPNIVGGMGVEVSREGVVQETHLFTGVVETAPADANYKTIYNIDTLGLAFDTTGVDSCAAIYDVKFFHNTTPDFCKDNDTMRLSQVFSNYYAYDDGTAEYAYGPIGTDGFETFLAYKFVLAKPDVLSGVAIHFSPSVVNNDAATFYLTIWDNSGPGGAPGNIIYQETALYDVIYGHNANNKFYVYPLSSLVNVSGTIYVGWKQTEIDPINIGFDRSNVTNDRIYYKVEFDWLTSSFKGSLMLRPVFNECVTDVVSVEEEVETEENKVSLYPNPARQLVNISSALPVEQVQVYDLTGQVLLTAGAANTIQLSAFAKGIYVVRVKTVAGLSVHRLVVE